MTSYSNFGVIGGGAWGTALAQLLAAEGAPVRLWAREEEVVTAINSEHRNPVFLPGAALSPSLTATGALADMADLDALLVVVPVPYLRAVLAALPPGDAPLIFCSKGMEAGSFAFPIDMARDLAPERPHAVLSGPAIARIENSVLDEVIVLDTICLPREKQIARIKTLTVAPVLAEAIARIYSDKPVSSLFV